MFKHLDLYRSNYLHLLMDRRRRLPRRMHNDAAVSSARRPQHSTASGFESDGEQGPDADPLDYLARFCIVSPAAARTYGRVGTTAVTCAIITWLFYTRPARSALIVSWVRLPAEPAVVCDERPCCAGASVSSGHVLCMQLTRRCLTPSRKPKNAQPHWIPAWSWAPPWLRPCPCPPISSVTTHFPAC